MSLDVVLFGRLRFGLLLRGRSHGSKRQDEQQYYPAALYDLLHPHPNSSFGELLQASGWSARGMTVQDHAGTPIRVTVYLRSSGNREEF